MKRREFTKLASLSAVAVSTTGFIQFDGKSYEGDCVTTTDILGPFYRPGSPTRSNLIIDGAPGDIVELTGIVRHKDCRTPYENAKVELWHCSADEIYDNESSEFRYRGTTYCDSEGKYKFRTQMPVPYDAGGGDIRPAHFHLMISARGYQSLITQIYFRDDPYLDQDIASSSFEGKIRTLDIIEEDDIKKVVFDCNMNDHLKPSYAALYKITGKYKNDANGNIVEYFENNGLLWKKNEVYGECYKYIGDNKFEYGGMYDGLYQRLHFNLQKDTIKLEFKASYKAGQEIKVPFTKI